VHKPSKTICLLMITSVLLFALICTQVHGLSSPQRPQESLSGFARLRSGNLFRLPQLVLRGIFLLVVW
jgi:hypothetical protein